MSEIYNEFARYYDCFMSHIDYETEAGEIFRLLFETGNTQNPVLDCGAGSGGHLLHLLALDANVDGLDFSEEMVELLKAKTVNFRERCFVYHGDMREMDRDISNSIPNKEGQKKYALIYSLGETVHHLKAYEDLGKFFAASCNMLEDGGLLVFSWKEPDYFDELMTYGDFYEEHGDNYLLWHIEEGADEAHYNLCYTAFVKAQGENEYRRLQEIHPSLVLEEVPLKKLAKANGFSLREDYAELCFTTSLKEEYKHITVLQKQQ